MGDVHVFRDRGRCTRYCNCNCRAVTCGTILSRLKKDLLLVLIITGAITGFIVGAIINGPVSAIVKPEDRHTTVMLIGFPGELLMSMLQMVILPLIVASLITALAALDAKATGKIGRRALVYYLCTTLSAAVLGMLLVALIQPGKAGRPDGQPQKSPPYRILDSFLDLIRSLFPSNLVEATIRQKKTSYSSFPAKYDSYNMTIDESQLKVNETITIFSNGTHNITTITRTVYPASVTVPTGTRMVPGMNVLGLTVFSIIFGIILGQLGKRGRVVREFFETINEIVMRIVSLVMWYSPVGICSLIATRVADMEDIGQALSMVGLFILTVLCGLSIHGLIVLPLMYFGITRKNPYTFLGGMRDALMTAFGISSSSATLPTTMRCLEENNKIDSRISKFVLPLGATVNMDGGALYEAVAAIFIAQISNIALTPATFIATCLTATAVSIGAAGIPSAGSVTTIIVLQAVNLPLEDIGLLMAIDWFLDRFRTTVNVLGDSIGAGIVGHLSRDDLLLLDHDACEEGDIMKSSRENKEDYCDIQDEDNNPRQITTAI